MRSRDLLSHDHRDYVSRDHTESLLDAVDRRLGHVPPWARSPFYGTLIVYMMMLVKRGGVIVPVGDSWPRSPSSLERC